MLYCTTFVSGRLTCVHYTYLAKTYLDAYGQNLKRNVDTKTD